MTQTFEAKIVKEMVLLRGTCIWCMVLHLSDQPQLFYDNEYRSKSGANNKLRK